MRRALLVLAISGLAQAAATAWALDPARPVSEYTLTTWNDRDGLPNTTIQDLAQTPDGYLWVATLEGLARFDGSRFATFDRSNTEEIPRNDIQTLLVAHDGSLWVASYGGGLVRYRQGVFERQTPPAQVGAQTINALAEGQAGELFVATGFGLLQLENGTYRPLSPDEATGRPLINDVRVDARNTTWVATPNGAFRLEGERLVPVPLPAAVAETAVSTLAVDEGQTLWLGTARGLVRSAGGRSALAVPTNAPVRVVLLDRHGGVWFGAGDRLGRLRHDQVEWLSASEGLSTGAVTALLQDREGSLWVGTGGGLTQIKDGAAVSYGVREGLPSPEVLAVAPAADGGLIAGTSAGEVARLVDGRFTPLGGRPAPLGGSRVLALLDEGRRLFVGTDDGLFVRSPSGWQREVDGAGLPRDSIRSVLRDAQGVLWIGTDGGGLVALERGKLRRYTRREGLPSNQVRALLARRDGTLLVATYGGLAMLRSGERERLELMVGLDADLIRSLHEDEDGVLWVGTYGSGLRRVEGASVKAITTREGLLSDVIYHILDDGSRLWMSCNRGIFAVSKEELLAFARGHVPRVRSEAYGREDGLHTEECSGGFPGGWRDEQGRLWFATEAGVVCLDPVRRMVGRRAAAPLVEDGFLAGRAVPLRGLLVVPPNAARLELRYTSVSFANADRMSFSYQLEGFDPAWVDAYRRRSATYTNLAPGSYRFRVRARSEGGDWRESEAPLEVRVEPNWYETRGFRVGLGLLVPLGLLVAYRLRIRGLLRRELELERRVEESVARVKVLRGLLPICAGCKKIRGSEGYWAQLEAYIKEHSEADFSHGLCPECARDWFPGHGGARSKARPGPGEPPAG